MVAKLSRPETDQRGSGSGGGAPAGWGSGGGSRAPADEAPRGRGGEQPENGRGAPAGWGNTTHDEHAEQRERIQEKIAPQGDRSGAARSAFTGGVADEMTRVADEYGTGEEAGNQSRGGWGGAGGGTTDAPFEGGKDAADKPATTRRSRSKASTEAAPTAESTLIAARAQVLAAVVTSSPDADVADIIDISRDLMAFVEQG